MEDHTETKGKVRRAKTAMEQIEDLLSKTVERGATKDEEVSAVQLAYQLSRRDKDVDGAAVKAAIEAIGGAEPRYQVTDDGFLVPASAVRTVEVERPGTSRAPGKIRAICERLLLQGVPTAEILKAVKTEVPDAETSKGCVSWYKSKMVKRAKEAGDTATLNQLRGVKEEPTTAAAQA